jgi:hypothetical protein
MLISQNVDTIGDKTNKRKLTLDSTPRIKVNNNQQTSNPYNTPAYLTNPSAFPK